MGCQAVFVRSNASKKARGFTLVELLVVIGIIALLIAVLLPSLVKVRAQANQTTCMSNMRQVNLALQFYVQENREYLPPPRIDYIGNSVQWQRLLDQYYNPSGNIPATDEEVSEVFRGCPEYEPYDINGNPMGPTATGYGMNSYMEMGKKPGVLDATRSWIAEASPGLFLDWVSNDSGGTLPAKWYRLPKITYPHGRASFGEGYDWHIMADAGPKPPAIAPYYGFAPFSPADVRRHGVVSNVALLDYSIRTVEFTEMFLHFADPAFAN